MNIREQSWFICRGLQMGGNLYYTILFLWCMPFVYVM